MERGSSELASSPPPPPRRESDASLQQLWVSSSPSVSDGHRKVGNPALQHQDSYGTPQWTPRNGSPLPPHQSMSQNSSTDALSSRDSNSADTLEGTMLSKEEEEAYMADYGSFEQLPEAHNPREMWSAHAGSSTEAASLLGNDLHQKATTQSYMALEEATPRQSNTDPNKKSAA